jgi:hypothetical protein
MTTTENNAITITMSETAPVKINLATWPKIASASAHDGQVECQANTEWYIAVREHDDGRRIVYGWQQAGNGGKPAGYRRKDAGYLISPRDGTMRQPAAGGPLTSKHPDEDATIRAIRRVAGVIGDEALGAECIGDLPAQEI